MKHFTLLGATGSIGKQAVEIVEEYPDEFKLEAISARNNVEAVKKILKHHNVKHVCMAAKHENTIRELALDVTFYALEDNGLISMINAFNDTVVFNALVGSVGLKATLEAIKNNQDVLLANKESLVVGGPLIKDALKTSKARLIPVDSEHAALSECLKGKDPTAIDKLIITASGGSFRHLDREALKDVTKSDALKHPNWDMGAKITIDSATMMNKVFEIIEAHYLFDIEYDKIEAILHDESIVHGIVHFKDGNVLAHIGPSDMRIPILSAMKEEKPLRFHSVFDITKIAQLNFKPIDYERYSLFDLGIAVARRNGMHVVTMNAANEVAVQRFLDEDIRFVDIETIIKRALDHFNNDQPMRLDTIEAHDIAVREYANQLKV